MILKYTGRVVSLIILMLVTTDASRQRNNIRFTDITRKAGIGFRYTFGDYTYKNILESSGSGITVFDFDNDRLMDLYLMNGTYIEGISDREGKVFMNTRNRLYKNKGDGTFTEVAASAHVDDSNWSMAAGAIDFDNDGDQDLFLLNYGPNVFYRNEGNGTFTNITGSTDLAGPEKLNGFTKWSIGVGFLDYNNDGLLDAMVGNFLAFDPDYISPAAPDQMPHPSEYKGQASMLYEQMPYGRFTDVTEKMRLYYPDSKCMGLTVYDYDGDGDLDIFQANDHQLNFMFRNDKVLYTEVGVESGVAANSSGRGTGSMHGTIGDVDGDGLIDLLVVDLDYGALYRNLGNGLFEDITESSGIAAPLAGKGAWGAALFDFDNDGDLDIVTANGTAEELILQYPLLLENDGKGHFRDAGREYGSYFSTKRSGRGLVVWDFDNDGDLDITISHVDLEASPALLRNDGGNLNNWLGLYLVGEKASSAIGAKVTVTAGGKKRVFVNQWATSYLSNNDPRLHVGLGKIKKVDLIDIVWSDGIRESIHDIASNQYITIVQNKGIVNN
jgi:hypothetical protein